MIIKEDAISEFPSQEFVQLQLLKNNLVIAQEEKISLQRKLLILENALQNTQDELKILKQSFDHSQLALSRAETVVSRYTNRFGRLPRSWFPRQESYGSPPGQSVVVVSMPKSGTVYINQLLAKGLGYWSSDIGYGHFPGALPDFNLLKVRAQGGWVSSQHYEPESLTVRRLDKYIKKWIVHIRDPRSVLLSWVHHIDHYGTKDFDDVDDGFYPESLQDYLKLDFSEKVDRNIEKFLPLIITWLKKWLLIIDSQKYNILLTTYDEFVESEEKFVHKILQFYNFPTNSFKMPAIEKNVSSSHFRKGSRDEWRALLSSSQLNQVNEMIGQDILNRFGWAD